MQRSILLVFAISTGLALAQGPPPGGPGGGKPAPTNLKVLTPQNYVQVMFSIPAALGVRCDFCHNMEDRASDEKPMKVTARRMMVMVKNINDTTVNGEQKVSCYTCHHGEQKPAAPPAGRGPGGPGGRGPGGPGAPGTPGAPGGPPPAGAPPQ
jgi:hypothetical protein